MFWSKITSKISSKIRQKMMNILKCSKEKLLSVDYIRTALYTMIRWACNCARHRRLTACSACFRLYSMKEQIRTGQPSVWNTTRTLLWLERHFFHDDSLAGRAHCDRAIVDACAAADAARAGMDFFRILTSKTFDSKVAFI